MSVAEWSSCLELDGWRLSPHALPPRPYPAAPDPGDKGVNSAPGYEKIDLKLSIQKTMIMASSPMTTRQIEGQRVDFIKWTL